MFYEELWRQRPGSVSHHFVHVATVTDGVVSLILIHHCEALVFVGQVITAHFEWLKEIIQELLFGMP